ncbi:MAG: hypothetical protein R3E58_19450 [Phycisphaerae bacterium]
MKTFAKVLSMGCLGVAIGLVGCKKQETPPPEAPPLPPLANTQPSQAVKKAPAAHTRAEQRTSAGTSAHWWHDRNSKK